MSTVTPVAWRWLLARGRESVAQSPTVWPQKDVPSRALT